MNRRSQFYKLCIKIPVARDYIATHNSSDHFLNSSLLCGPATIKSGKKVENTMISTRAKLGTFYESFASLPIVEAWW